MVLGRFRSLLNSVGTLLYWIDILNNKSYLVYFQPYKIRRINLKLLGLGNCRLFCSKNWPFQLKQKILKSIRKTGQLFTA